jgi:hypothetical protein
MIFFILVLKYGLCEMLYLPKMNHPTQHEKEKDMSQFWEIASSTKKHKCWL